MKYKLKEHMVLVAAALAYVLLAASLTLSYYIHWSIVGIILIILCVLACGFLTYAFVFDLRLFLKNKKEAEAKEKDNDVRRE